MFHDRDATRFDLAETIASPENKNRAIQRGSKNEVRNSNLFRLAHDQDQRNTGNCARDQTADNR